MLKIRYFSYTRPLGIIQKKGCPYKIGRTIWCRTNNRIKSNGLFAQGLFYTTSLDDLVSINNAGAVARCMPFVTLRSIGV